MIILEVVHRLGGSPVSMFIFTELETPAPHVTASSFDTHMREFRGFRMARTKAKECFAQ